MAGFGRHERLRKRSEFQQVYERGAKVHGRYSTMFVLSNGLPSGRLGIAATRKLGGAVERNRAKRLIREVFRLSKLASGFDVVIVPKRELLEASLSDLETEYRQNFGKTLRRGGDGARRATRL